MEKLHILLVLPHGKNFALVKQTGMLALALQSAGLQVSLLVDDVTETPLQNLGPNIKVYLCPEVPQWQLWRTGLAQGLKAALAADNTIDIVHLMSLAWPAPTAALVTRKINVPLIARTHREDDLTGESLPLWQKTWLKKLMPAIKPLVVGSSHLLDTGRKLGLADLVLIPDGVNTDHFKPVLSKRPIRRALGLPEKPTLVCCMASVEEANKQLELLQRCLPLGDNLQILFIGDVTDPGYLAAIQAVARHHNALPYVHFIDAVEAPEDYLKASDLFMLMGGIEERHGTILEAQSAGLPVVLAPAPSSLLLTNSNKCGVVLYPNNPLVNQAFEKLLHDATYRQGRAVHTRPYVKKEFDFKTMVQAYIRLYNSL